MRIVSKCQTVRAHNVKESEKNSDTRSSLKIIKPCEI